MRKSSAPLLLSVLTAVAFLAGAADREVVYPREFQAPTPSFDNGYLVSYDGPPPGGIVLYGPAGQRLYELPAAPPGQALGSIAQTAVDTDGTLAALYHGPNHFAGILLAGPSGAPRRWLRTDPYMPTHVCFASDHSVWTIGQHADPDTDYAVFRKYSPDLTLLGEFVKRSELGAAMPGQVAQAILGHWTMRAAKDRVGASLDFDFPGGVWIELNLDGKLIGKWEFDRSVYHLGALTAEGVLYAQKGRSTAVLDRTSGQFQPVPSMPHAWLLGAQGEDLVFFVARDRLEWVHPPDPPAAAVPPSAQ